MIRCASYIMIKIALFDYDVTLVNTEEAHLSCWNLALEKYGIAIDEAFYITHCVGIQTVHIAGQMKKELSGISDPALELAAEKDALFEHWIATKPVHLMPGVREMLAFLLENNIEIGLVTGAQLASFQKTLQDHDIARFFKTIVTRESVANAKPAPDGYLLALRQMGAHAGESVAFEDSRIGVLAARAAGMIVFAIPSSYTVDHDFSAAHVVCRDMHEARSTLVKMINWSSAAEID